MIYRTMAETTFTWNTPSDPQRIIEILTEISVTTDDTYIRHRAKDLIKDIGSLRKALALAITLRSAPEKNKLVVQLQGKLGETWCDFTERLLPLGLPAENIWKAFLVIHDQTKRRHAVVTAVAKKHGLHRDDITALLVAYVNDPLLHGAWETHWNESQYMFRPYSEERHSYDFFAVIWPLVQCLSANLTCDYSQNIRALRAVGLLVHARLFDDFCNDFDSTVILPLKREYGTATTTTTTTTAKPKRQVTLCHLSHTAYDGLRVPHCTIGRLVKYVLGMNFPMQWNDMGGNKKLTSNRHAVSALADVARLMGIIGEEKGFFIFDAICGFSIHPSVRLVSRTNDHVMRWYGVSCAVLRKLQMLSENKLCMARVPIAPLARDDMLIWIDAKEDMRLLVSATKWADLAVKATKLTFNSWQVEDDERREREREKNRQEIHRALNYHVSKSNIQLEVIEYEPNQCVQDNLGHYITPVSIPCSDNNLKTLVEILGYKYLMDNHGFLTRQVMSGPLACLFSPGRLKAEFLRGLKIVFEFLTYSDHSSLCHESVDEESIVYDMYKKYYETDKEDYFLDAMKACALECLEDHHFIALRELSKKMQHLDSYRFKDLNWIVLKFAASHDIPLTPHCVLEQVLCVHENKVRHLDHGTARTAMLDYIDHLTTVIIPKCYRMCDLRLSDICLPVMKTFMLD